MLRNTIQVFVFKGPGEKVDFGVVEGKEGNKEGNKGGSKGGNKIGNKSNKVIKMTAHVMPTCDTK